MIETVETERILSCVMELLQRMTEAGAEIYRIEESASAILKSYGAYKAEVYATPSNIILSVEMEEGKILTHTGRIGEISTNIEKLHRLNSLVRRISRERIPSAKLREELDLIEETPHYPVPVLIFFYGLIAGAFYLFFGGRDYVELVFSFGIGLLTGVWHRLFGSIQLNQILIKFLCSFSACMLSFALGKIGLAENTEYMIIGNIMTLIPGIGLTNSLRDIFVGDSISGVLRLMEAALLALAIAGGYILNSVIFGGAL